MYTWIISCKQVEWHQNSKIVREDYDWLRVLTILKTSSLFNDYWCKMQNKLKVIFSFTMIHFFKFYFLRQNGPPKKSRTYTYLQCFYILSYRSTLRKKKKGWAYYTFPFTLWMGSTTTATALSDKASKLCWVLISTPDNQQPKPGWLWYQPTTISGLKQRGCWDS